MKKFFLYVFALISLNVSAGSLPEKIECQIIRGSAVSCIDPNRPQTEPYYFKDYYGQTKVGVRRTWVFVNCIQNVCRDTDGNPRGHADIDHRFNVAIPPEYVLANINGAIYAVRNTGADTSPAVSEKLDIWCDPQGDTCTTPKGELSREELPKHFKFADVNSQGIDCMQELCYNQNQDVVGLNPEYSLYQ